MRHALAKRRRGPPAQVARGARGLVVRLAARECDQVARQVGDLGALAQMTRDLVEQPEAVEQREGRAPGRERRAGDRRHGLEEPALRHALIAVQVVRAPGRCRRLGRPQRRVGQVGRVQKVHAVSPLPAMRSRPARSRWARRGSTVRSRGP